MSLRLRLTVLVLIMFLIGAVAVVTRTLSTAHHEVERELESTQFLTRQLLDMMLRELNQGGGETAAPDFLERLAELEAARHIDVSIVSFERNYPQFNEVREGEPRVPGWFADLLDLDEEVLLQSFDFGGDTVVVRTDPSDEINEIWDETRTELVSNMFLLVLFNVAAYIALGFWLRPLKQMADSLHEMVRGDYSRRVPELSLPELRNVAQRINELTAVLGASRTENERLAQQALTIQEQDRRRLAQELHDSLGQAVSAIKATAVSIANRTVRTDPAVAESALSIERISDDAYASVRVMMAELRPQVLDELGLELALQQMVEEWNTHHEDTFCRLRIEGKFDDLAEEQQINLYRIVQETLTNVAKHAGAEHVSITLSGQEVISLIIIDDGVGFEPHRVRTGMGLSGLRDRVLLLRGTLQLTSNMGRGTTIQIEIPRKFQLRRRRDDK